MRRMMSDSTDSCSSSDDWQADKELVQCCRHMFSQQLFCDVHFLVGEEKQSVGAHKFILICRSSVFRAMFCGSLAETEGNIEIPDVDIETFRAFLTYLYTDEVELTAESVLSTLYVAKKYSVNTLVRKCLQYLGTDRNVENICCLIEQARLYDEEEFLQKSIEFVYTHAREVLKTSSFQDLSAENLKKIISADELQADERTVLDAAIKWAEKRCEKQNLDPSPNSVRGALGDMLYLIRFPLLGESYFTNVVSDMGILTDSEKVELFKYFYKTGGTTERFVTINRYAEGAISQNTVPAEMKPGDRSIQTCMRFTQVCDDGSWYCGGEPDAVAFTASRDINLYGALVYGSYIGEGNYDVTCNVYDSEDTELVQLRMQIKTSEHQQTYIILFQSPVEIQAGRKYTLLVRLISPDGIDTYQGKGGLQSLNVASVKFIFSKSKYSRNGTDTKMGQIPGLLFSL